MLTILLYSPTPFATREWWHLKYTALAEPKGQRKNNSAAPENNILMIQYSISVFPGTKSAIKICIRHLLVEKYGLFSIPLFFFLYFLWIDFLVWTRLKEPSFYWIITVFLSLSALLSGTLRTFQRRTCDSDKVSLACPRGTSISIELAQYEKNGIGKSSSSKIYPNPKLKSKLYIYTRKPKSFRVGAVGWLFVVWSLIYVHFVIDEINSFSLILWIGLEKLM